MDSAYFVVLIEQAGRLHALSLTPVPIFHHLIDHSSLFRGSLPADIKFRIKTLLKMLNAFKLLLPPPLAQAPRLGSYQLGAT